MSLSRRPVRYAHADGPTDVCFTDDGKYIVTCGSDGDIRVWCGLEDDDPTSHCVGETAFALAFKDKHLFVGTDLNNVQAFKFPEMERDGVICFFTAPVTQIAVSNDGTKLVVGSRNMSIKVCERSSLDCEALSGHSAPVLGVSVDPLLKYMASSSCDGTIRVWSLDSLKCLHIWSCLPACNSFTSARCLGRTSWEPIAGKYVAVPDDLSIVFYERETWENVKSFSDERIKKPFSIALFSPCGQYLVGSTTLGEICIWSVKQAVCLSYTEHHQNCAITALAWNPTKIGVLAFCDEKGQFGTVEGELVSNVNEPEEPGSIAGDTELEDSENVLSIDEIKSVVSRFIRPEEKEEGESDVLSKADEDDNISEDEAIKFKQQPPFQPSSTPDTLLHRYMVWNSVGIIRCSNTETENSIDVEFHDSSLHHSIFMNNFLRHTLASLSEKALLLACEAQDVTPSKIVCVLLDSWDGTKEWTMDIPEGEEALAIACANKWLAVATDVRNLRFFTIAGAQREVLSLPGPVVCLAAQGNFLLVICYHGTGLGYTLLSIRRCSIDTVMPFQPIPLTPGCTLQWAGFSDEGTPTIVDSIGMLRILSPNGYWLPVCDTQAQTRGKSDHFFVIGVSEKYKNIRCILCKGSHYPPTTPRPTVMELPLKVPLCDATSEKSILEETFWTNTLLFRGFDNKIEAKYAREKEEADKTIKVTIMKLFALACRNGLEQRALDLCLLMPSEEAVQLALKYASKLGKIQLAERIGDFITESAAETVSELNETTVQSRHMFSRLPSKKMLLNKKLNGKNGSEDEVCDSTHSDATSESRGILVPAIEAQRFRSLTSSLTPKQFNPFKKEKKNEKQETESPQPTAVTENSNSEASKFMKWYNDEKRKFFKKKYPFLDDASRLEVAAKNFRKEVEKSDIKSKESSKSKSAKLLESTVSEQISSSQSETIENSEKNCEESNTSNTTLEKDLESKKRKLDETEESGVKGISKLAKFAFKK